MQPGDILGERYRIKSALGQGGMGAVFLAEDLKLKRKQWAVKAISVAPGDETRMALEAEMLVSLSHPQLPHIVDYFVPNADGVAYMVMDYVQGPSLQDAFEQNGRKLTDSVIVHYAVQLCELLHYLHTYKPRPIIYRDLKPSNIMIDESGRLRLIDFGIARHYKYGQHADTVRIGTIGFAAPEQIAGEQTDSRSDLYALGALLYYLLTQGKMYYVASAPLSEVRPDLPVSFTHLVDLLLKEDVRERMQSALEARDRLQAISHVNFIQDRSFSDVHSRTKNKRPFTDDEVHNRLIVIGGLYPGAGSTFVAITLARMLHAYGIANCLVEQPTIEPDLYMLLYGDKYAPRNYRFDADMIAETMDEKIYEPGMKSPAWSDGWTTWVPSNPDGSQGEWSIAHSFKLLHRVRKPITIWDVSTAWEDPSVIELCRAADHVIAVADASPVKLNRPSARRRMQAIDKAEWVANRESIRGNRDWYTMMPKPPLCSLPNLSHEAVLRSVWKGTCIQDEPEIREQLVRALAPILKDMLPKGAHQVRASRQQSSLWGRFRRHAK